MKTLKIKQSTSVICVALILIMSCEDVNIQNASNSQYSAVGIFDQIENYSLDGNEGAPILLDTAASWLRNYLTKYPVAKGHFVGAESIKRILAQKGCIGIRFYHAIDDLGNLQLLLRPTDKTGNDIKFILSTRANVSSINIEGSKEELMVTGGDSLKEKDFDTWTNNFNSQNQNTIRAHFFGYQIINEILSEFGCIGIRMHSALNEKGIPQLLLIGAEANGRNLIPSRSSITGRVEDQNNTIADASYPCPSFCSGK